MNERIIKEFDLTEVSPSTSKMFECGIVPYQFKGREWYISHWDFYTHEPIEMLMLICYERVEGHKLAIRFKVSPEFLLDIEDPLKFIEHEVDRQLNIARNKLKE